MTFFSETAFLFGVTHQTCFGAGNFYKDLFFVYPQSGVNKLILAILTLQFDDVAMKTTYWFVITE